MDRRNLMFGAVGFVVLGSAARGQPGTSPTPGEDVGPYYPVVGPSESTADLTNVGNVRAAGQIIDLRLRVADRQGRPLHKAIVVLWQGDSNGVYPHPTEIRRPDPGFGGHALLRTDANGEVRLLSVMPGPYKARFLPGMRTSHIHFEVLHADTRLVTQMYFPGQPLNAQDELIRRLRAAGEDPARVTATATGSAEPGTTAYRWEMIVA